MRLTPAGARLLLLPSLRAAIVIATLASIPSLAFAAPLYLQFNGEVAAQVVTLNYDLPGHPTLDGQFYAGQYSATVSPNSDLSDGMTFNTFCVDLDHEVNNGQIYPVNVTSTSVGLANGGAIAYLYQNYGVATLTDPDYATALQLAIWDEVANGGQGQSATSPLQYSIPDQAVATDLAFFLADANSHTAGGEWLQSVDNPVGYTQGQGFLVPAAQPVPEPSTLLMASVSVMGVLLFRRRYAFANTSNA